jgi:cyclopropane fatty-acyl-phospholipid synthase-like methyltransferase
MADFVGKQFDKEEVGKMVLEQYDEAEQRLFYTIVMGGGGDDIHFGIYRDAKDGVRESSAATTAWMMTQLDMARPIGAGDKLLDIGSGHGGGSHALAKKYGCSVMGYNIGPGQNAQNIAKAKELGLGDLVDAVVGDINKPFPADWTNSFDGAWSCEVLCHAGDKPELFKEVARVLKPGAAFVFSDIMGADGADEKTLKGFTDRNATTVMGRPSTYLQCMKDAGLDYVTWWDGSNHLETYFRDMIKQIHTHREEMLSKGLTDKYLDNWLESLTERADTQRDHGVFAWGVFVCRKPLN